MYPVTDGSSILYEKEVNGKYSLILYNNNTSTLLCDNTFSSSPPGGYTIENGWIAYSKNSLLGQPQIWLRNPSGEEIQITHLGSGSPILTLSANGKIVFSNYSTGALYYADYENPDPIKIGNYISGNAVWIADTLYYSIGPGLFKLDMNTVGIEVKHSTAQDFHLEQNYPNPFNPTTNIRFSIEKPGMVSLKIYNVLGQEVTTLLNKELKAGTYTFNFDGSKLSSGIYFYRIRSGNFVQTNKMVLLK